MTPEERWQKIENGMQFLLEQQARADARREADAAKHKADMDEIRGILRRAIRLGVQEARSERRKRREGDERLRQGMEELRAAQEATQHALRAFIDSLNRGRNGHPAA
jgi:hypothetical protein